MKLTKEQLVKIIKEELAEAEEGAPAVSKGGDPRPLIQRRLAGLANTVHHFRDTTLPLLRTEAKSLDEETKAAATELLARVEQLMSDMQKYAGV